MSLFVCLQGQGQHSSQQVLWAIWCVCVGGGGGGGVKFPFSRTQHAIKFLTTSNSDWTVQLHKMVSGNKDSKFQILVEEGFYYVLNNKCSGQRSVQLLRSYHATDS